MKLNHDRLAHIVCGRMFLSNAPDTSLSVYRHILERAYGSLDGIKIIRLVVGAELAYTGESYLLPYAHEYEVLV